MLKAARSLLARSGVKGMTIDAVAREAGVGKPTVYRRWPSRAALLFEISFRADPAVLPVPETGSAHADLLEGLTALANSFTSQLGSDSARAILTEVLSDEALRSRFRDEQLARDRRVVADIVRRGVARGDVEAGYDPELQVEMLMAWLIDRCLIRDEPPSPREIETAIEIVLGPARR